MSRIMPIRVGVLLLLSALSSCTSLPPEGPSQEAAAIATIQIESSAFQNGGSIPVRYTCDGDDLSPPLSWSALPAGTQSLALIGDDPDAPAGTWVHWVLFNLPADPLGLPEALPPGESLVRGGIHGSNSWHKLGYGGPCPPSGSTHRYSFRLYALDTTLDLQPGADKRDLENAMEGHILAKGELIGLFGR